MGDAEIIPLGTRGRPGRGSGSAKPSSATRGLAGASRAKASGRERATPGPAEADAPPDEAPSTAASAPRGPASQPAAGTAPGHRVPVQGTRRVEPLRSLVPDAAAETSAQGDRAEPVGPDPTPGPDADPDAARDALPPSSSDDDAEAAAGADQGPEGQTAAAAEDVRERVPTAGIPVADWLQALTAAAVEVLGDRWEPRAAELVAMLRRRVTGDYEVDEYGFDVELTERLLLATVRPLADRWFRVEVLGAENIPAEGGALVVSNHSGTVPMDGLMTAVSVLDTTGRNLRPLGADLVFRLPFIGELARKGGVTLASNEDAQRMLADGELVGVWPEGFKGIGKPYSERYKLQRFGRGGFVSAAIRTGVPIIPCSVVGAEEIYPLIGDVPALARLLGLPYLPVTPLFPWLGPLGLVPLPSKWLIEFGEPIRTDSYDEGAADDPMLVFNVTDQVRETIQQTLYQLLMRRTSVFS